MPSMLYPVLIHVSNVMPTHRRVCFFAVRPDANPNHGGWGGTDQEILCSFNVIFTLGFLSLFSPLVVLTGFVCEFSTVLTFCDKIRYTNKKLIALIKLNN